MTLYPYDSKIGHGFIFKSASLWFVFDIFFPVKPPSFALSETENKSLLFRSFGQIRLDLFLHWHMVIKVKVTFWITDEEYITGSIRPLCMVPLLVTQHSNNIHVIYTWNLGNRILSSLCPPPLLGQYTYIWSASQKNINIYFLYEGLFSLQHLC